MQQEDRRRQESRQARAELRERIRARLSQARTELGAGQASDPLLQALVTACPDRALAERRLTQAILGFERAPVFTIHGFCQRVLRDRAFESGMPFDSELEPDQSELLQELADDFWRLRVQDLPPGLADQLVAEDLRPEQLLKEVEDGLGKPYLEPRGRALPADLAELERLAREVENAVGMVPGTRSAVAERPMGGAYLNIEIDREAAAPEARGSAGNRREGGRCHGGLSLLKR